MTWQRTHTCGDLRAENNGEDVILNGWVDTRRDLGGVIFIDLRDRYGKTQVVFSPQDNPQAHQMADLLRSEYVIGIKGKLQNRSEETINKSMPTGMVEVRGYELQIYSKAQTPPFEIKDDLNANDDIKLKYRYLDLRRPVMQQKLMLRSKSYQIIRDYFHKLDFAEIETPVLMKSTPEGARDYLVPSRVNPGKFFALPQSPQTYKQILMISGFDKYMQIVKCFRDEDLRADRQPEFTQVDLEMSFVNEEVIFSTIEGLMYRWLKETLDVEISTPFPRLTYQQAMETYGSDKPDTRFDCTFFDASTIVKSSEFRVFSKTVEDGGIVAGFVVPGLGHLGRGVMDRMTKMVRDEYGAGGLIYIKNNENEIYSSVAKFVKEEMIKAVVTHSGAQTGDLILLFAGEKEDVYKQLGQLRTYIGKEYELIDESKFNLLWVTDFPLVEYNVEEGRYYAMHHPFTSPREEDIALMGNDPLSVKSRAYDLVLNGFEIGGGSIRIHDYEVQQKMFELLGIGEKDAEEKFGFLMNAFKYGAPPHGGIALGVDRIVMLLTGAKSLREVIAFPKNQRAVSLMDNAPDVVEQSQLDELHIQLKPLIK